MRLAKRLLQAVAMIRRMIRRSLKDLIRIRIEQTVRPMVMQVSGPVQTSAGKRCCICDHNPVDTGPLCIICLSFVLFVLFVVTFQQGLSWPPVSV